MFLLSSYIYGVASEITGLGYRLTNLETDALGGIQTEFAIADNYWVVRFGYRIPTGFGRIGVSVVTQDILPQFLTSLVPIDIGAGLSLLLTPNQHIFTLSTSTNVVLERDRVDWIYPRTDFLYIEVRYFRNPRRGNTFLVKFGSDPELIKLYTSVSILYTLPSSPLYFVVSAESLVNNLSIHETTYLNYSPFATFLPSNAEPLLMSRGDYVIHGLVKGHWRDNLRGFTKNYDLYLQQLQVRSEGILEPTEIVFELLLDSNFFEPEPDEFSFDIGLEFSVVANPSEFIVSEFALEFIIEPVPPIELEFDFAIEKIIQEFRATFYEDLIIGELAFQSDFIEAELIRIVFELAIDYVFVNPDIEVNLFLALDLIFQEETFEFRWDIAVEFELELLDQIVAITHLVEVALEDSSELVSVVGTNEIPELAIEFIIDEVVLIPEELTQEVAVKFDIVEVEREPIEAGLSIEFVAEEVLPINLVFDLVVEIILEEINIISSVFDIAIDILLDEVPAIDLITELGIEFVFIEGQIEATEFSLAIDYLLEEVEYLEIDFGIALEQEVIEVPTESIEFSLALNIEVIEVPKEDILSELSIDTELIIADKIPPIDIEFKLATDLTITEIESIALIFELALDTAIEVISVESIVFSLALDDLNNFRPILSNPIPSFDLAIEFNLELIDQIDLIFELSTEQVLALLPPILVGPGIINCDPLYFQVFDLYYDEYCLLSIETHVSQSVQAPDSTAGSCNPLVTRVYELSADVNCLLSMTTFIAGHN